MLKKPEGEHLQASRRALQMLLKENKVVERVVVVSMTAIIVLSRPKEMLMPTQQISSVVIVTMSGSHGHRESHQGHDQPCLRPGDRGVARDHQHRNRERERERERAPSPGTATNMKAKRGAHSTCAKQFTHATPTRKVGAREDRLCVTCSSGHPETFPLV